MLKILRWLGRGMVGLGLLGLILCGVVIWVFSGWQAAREQALVMGSRLVETSAGVIEVAEAGDGPPVLVLHGGPGGYDQGLVIGQALVEAGYRVIAPSRPGYLRTPMEVGLTFEDEADALVGMLVAMGIDEPLPVVGFSSGATAAAVLARKHPARVRGLVLYSPVTRKYKERMSLDMADRMLTEQTLFGLTGDMGAWVMMEAVKRDPDGVMAGVLAMDTTLSAGDRARQVAETDGATRAFLAEFLETVTPLSSRETGTRKDLVLLQAMADWTSFPEAVPTLAIFGEADAGAQWASPEGLKTALPEAEIEIVSGVGELVWLGPSSTDVGRRVLEFLGSLPSAAAAASP